MTQERLAGRPADSARPQDVALYGAMLGFMNQRLAYVDEMLARPPRNRVELEACALQVRMTLEHIVLSTLVTNRPAAATIVAAFAKKKASEVHGLIKRINSRYWPIPFDWSGPEDSNGGTWTMVEPSEPYLREEEWGRAYGYCSRLLHATNPYEYLTTTESRSESHRAHIGQLKEYSHKIERLLKNHQIYLSEVDCSLICAIPEDPTVPPDVDVWIRQAK